MNDNEFFLIGNLIQNLAIKKTSWHQSNLSEKQREMLLEQMRRLRTINELKSIQLFESP
jgi:hypothetical protein